MSSVKERPSVRSQGVYRGGNGGGDLKHYQGHAVWICGGARRKPDIEKFCTQCPWLHV